MRCILFAGLALAVISPACAAEKAGATAIPPAAGDANAPVVEHNRGLSLTMDEVRTLTFKGPIATVYVGNPAIADITMIDSRHAFLLGKGFGRTNIVALNHDGDQVYNARVAVTGGSAETLTLNRGAQRVTYNCTGGRCEPSPTPGDSKDMFEQMNSQQGTHSDAAHKAALGQN